MLQKPNQTNKTLIDLRAVGFLSDLICVPSACALFLFVCGDVGTKQSQYILSSSPAMFWLADLQADVLISVLGWSREQGLNNTSIIDSQGATAGYSYPTTARYRLQRNHRGFPQLF